MLLPVFRHAQMATYTYLVDIRTTDEKQYLMAGKVTLLR